MRKRRTKKIKVRFRKLGRERAMGQAWADGVVEIDPRQGQKAILNTLIHELLHICEPEWTESHVNRVANTLAGYIWLARFRRIETGFKRK